MLLHGFLRNKKSVETYPKSAGPISMYCSSNPKDPSLNENLLPCLQYLVDSESGS